MGIRRFAMYDPKNPAIDGLLHDMATQEFGEIGNSAFLILKTRVKSGILGQTARFGQRPCLYLNKK